MRSAEVQADLRQLLDLPEAPSYLAELMAAKAEAEHGRFVGPDSRQLSDDVARLESTLEQAATTTSLPDAPTASAA